MSDRVLAVYGTRPEAIKLAPVITALRRRDRFETIVCTTAQHREMVDQVEALLGLEADLDLDLMTPAQQSNGLTARVVAAVDDVLATVQPDWLIVQGDTTTAMAACLAAFHRHVPVGHVEAGLRSGDLSQPFPEEANRRVIDLLSRMLFAPTASARDALLAEGVAAERVHVTGNTVIDAVLGVAVRMAVDPVEEMVGDEVLITVHRRESFGPPIRGIFDAVAELAARFPAVRWICPVHPNPQVRAPAHDILGAVANVVLLEPLDYTELIRHLRRARFALTDSGGIQEEAPTFGTPVLVLREKTERPEGVAAGVARLVGTDRDRIVAAATELLTRPEVGAAMVAETNPYGDGRAAERIAAILAGETVAEFVWSAGVAAAAASRVPGR